MSQQAEDEWVDVADVVPPALPPPDLDLLAMLGDDVFDVTGEAASSSSSEAAAATTSVRLGGPAPPPPPSKKKKKAAARVSKSRQFVAFTAALARSHLVCAATRLRLLSLACDDPALAAAFRTALQPGTGKAPPPTLVSVSVVLNLIHAWFSPAGSPAEFSTRGTAELTPSGGPPMAPFSSATLRSLLAASAASPGVPVHPTLLAQLTCVAFRSIGWDARLVGVVELLSPKDVAALQRGGGSGGRGAPPPGV